MMYQRNIDLERKIQGLTGPGAVQPRQCSIESSSDTVEEEARPPNKRRRLMEGDLHRKSHIDDITSQLLSQSSQEKHSSLRLDQIIRPTPSVRHDCSPMVSSSPTFNLEQTGSAFTGSAPYSSRRRPAIEARSLVQAGPVNHYHSSPHYSATKQSSGPELMAPFQNGSIRRLSIDDYTPKTSTTAYSYNPRQVIASSHSQRISKHFPVNIKKPPPSANISISNHSDGLHSQERTQPANNVQRRTSGQVPLFNSTHPTINKEIGNPTQNHRSFASYHALQRPTESSSSGTIHQQNQRFDHYLPPPLRPQPPPAAVPAPNYSTFKQPSSSIAAQKPLPSRGLGRSRHAQISDFFLTFQQQQQQQQ